jgi:two-component system response regulator HydG
VTVGTSTYSISPELADRLEEYSDPAVLLSPECFLVAVNAAYQRVFGDIDLSKPTRCYEVAHGYFKPCHEAGEDCPLKSSLASGEPRRTVHVHHTPRGEEHIDEETFPIRNTEGAIVYFMQILRPTYIASARFALDRMVGRTPAFNRMVELIHRVAPSDTSVLLLGETGTGKELAAQAIHHASRRAEQPFVPLDCSGLSENLFESELFGHEKGAFTGAISEKSGLVEAAHGGSLFLDEIGDIPLALQVKLLRLLETASYRRVGSVEPRRADFRLICATHRDLLAMVEAATFRKDLYYRLSVFPIRVPPLKERRADIPLLAQVMLYKLVGEASPRLHPEALACLVQYDFPGNIRELRHLLERALLLTDGDTILPSALPDHCLSPVSGGTPLGGEDTEIYPLKVAEQRYLKHLRTTYKGDKKTLAHRLGVSERTLYRKLEALREDPDLPSPENHLKQR